MSCVFISKIMFQSNESDGRVGIAPAKLALLLCWPGATVEEEEDIKGLYSFIQFEVRFKIRNIYKKC